MTMVSLSLSSILRNIMCGPVLFGLHLPWMLLMLLGIILIGPYAPVCLAEYSGLLLNTLKSQFTFACENEIMSIKCPDSTHILVESANYGRLVPAKEMCPYKWSTIGAYQLHDFITEDTNCRSETSLEPVITLCNDKTRCKFRVDNDLFGEDPCPGTNKYLDVTYKCKPSVFQTTVVCEDEHLQLLCPENTILAIYSAMFGRSQQGTIECPSFTMQEVDCQSSDAYQQILSRCHGRKHCAVKASTRVFGEPCLPGTYKYLKVVYSCVSKSIFRKPRTYPYHPEQPSNIPEPTSNYIEGTGGDGHDLYSHDMFNTEHPNYSISIYEGKGDESYSDSPFITLAPNNSTRNNTTHQGNTKIGIITSIVNAVDYIKANKETVLLYFIIGCLIGIVLTLLWCVCRIKLHNRKLKKKITGTGTLTQVDGANGDPRNNGIMEIVRQENRVDIARYGTVLHPINNITRNGHRKKTRTRKWWDERYQWDQYDAGLIDTPARGISHTHGPRNGLNTSTSFTLGTAGNGLGLMLDGIDLSDLWNSNTLPGSRNLNSYFP
ncbi:uncharacterized protein [Amphiura filiformis]|uniref:uncharacterized protein isoform X2 n=1 Tax=Amphiura filiformis TaxID=82378 RepID=UPI003B2286D1